MTQKYWFRKKRWGYGWTPATKEGWSIMAISMLVLVAAAWLLAPKDDTMGDWHNLAAFFLILTLDVLCLALVCAKKGEPLR